jgi:hypothetical protein
MFGQLTSAPEELIPARNRAHRIGQLEMIRHATLTVLPLVRVRVVVLILWAAVLLVDFVEGIFRDLDEQPIDQIVLVEHAVVEELQNGVAFAVIVDVFGGSGVHVLLLGRELPIFGLHVV